MEKFVMNDGRMTFFIKKNDAKFFLQPSQKILQPSQLKFAASFL